jgi:hypothetical protein
VAVVNCRSLPCIEAEPTRFMSLPEKLVAPAGEATSAKVVAAARARALGDVWRRVFMRRVRLQGFE